MTEQNKYEQWRRQENLDAEVREQLEAMKGNRDEIFDSFYRELSFGTAGLRGVLGAGTNRMNVYTVGKATAGFAAYLKENFTAPSIAIAYDCRINSEKFARLAARIMAAQGIRVHLYGELMPTPMLSYAVRYYHCDGGIVVTASHNPAKYNGYKVYGPDGCQAGPEMADAILSYIDKTPLFALDLAPEDDPLIETIPDSTVEAFLQDILQKRVCRDRDAVKDLKIVYTPLNGTGRMPVRRLMEKMGITQVEVVPEQEMPDGTFPTCAYPNPENRDALQMGIELAGKLQYDLVIGTDPDADRVGTAIRQKDGFRLISGNEMGVLMLDYICRVRKENGTMPPCPVAVKTIVTTAMVDDVALFYGVELRSVLTGFKFIGEIITSLDEQGRADDYLLGFEESYGYLVGDHARDKDAISAVMMICDMAAYYKKQGMTLVDVLDGLFEKFGYYSNQTVSFSFEGASGMEKMGAIMDSLRQNPPAEAAGALVTSVSDYLLSQKMMGGEKTVLTLPKSNVLGYTLSDGCSFVVRPSGTEPKLKVYIFAKAATERDAETRIRELKEAIERFIR